MRTRSFTMLLFAAWLVGCSDPMGPPIPSGLFLLERVSGLALPAVIHEDAVYRYVTVADSFTVSTAGNGEQSSVQRVERIDGSGTPYMVSMRVPIGFRSARGGLRYLRGCPINAACAPSAPVVVTRTVDGLAFTFGNERLEYRAVETAP